MKDVMGAPTDETLEQLRERVAASLADAKASLADLEDENRRVRAELQLVMSNRGRRTLAAAQHRIARAIALLCHPLWVIETALRHPSPRLREGRHDALYPGRPRHTLAKRDVIAGVPEGGLQDPLAAQQTARVARVPGFG